MLGEEKKKKRIVRAAALAGVVVLTAVGCKMLVNANIPYSYRQSLLDVVDYVAARNVFHRADSLQ